MRAAVTVLVACALLPLVAACEPRTTSENSVYCEVMPDAPSRDNVEAPKLIVAAVRYRCDEPGASSLQLTMRLQRQNSAGTWVNVTSTSFTAKGSGTVPRPHEAFRTAEISAKCADGVYRTRVTGSSRARSGTRSYDKGSPRAVDPCEGLFTN